MGTCNQKTNTIQPSFSVDDFFLVRRAKITGLKLQFLWIGSRQIVGVERSLVYLVFKLDSSELEVVHHAHLQMYHKTARTRQYPNDLSVSRSNWKRIMNSSKNLRLWRELRWHLFASSSDATITQKWLDVVFHMQSAYWSLRFCHRLPQHNKNENISFSKCNEDCRSFSLTLQASPRAM